MYDDTQMIVFQNFRAFTKFQEKNSSKELRAYDNWCVPLSINNEYFSEMKRSKVSFENHHRQPHFAESPTIYIN